MPKTVYLCDICWAEHDDHQKATQCESQGNRAKHSVGEKVCFRTWIGKGTECTVAGIEIERYSHRITYIIAWEDGFDRIAEENIFPLVQNCAP